MGTSKEDEWAVAVVRVSADHQHAGDLDPVILVQDVTIAIQLQLVNVTRAVIQVI
jgi:hypothetical protein